MEEDRMPKKIFTQELEGTRRRGRSRKSWKEEVERDLQVLGVRRWRELVADRKKMEETLFDRPKPTVGCSANGRRKKIIYFFIFVPCILLQFTFISPNTCTCESHSISVNTLNVKNKPLKLLELQHVSVFHKTILREPLVPVKVTYCPLLFFKVCWQLVLFYL